MAERHCPNCGGEVRPVPHVWEQGMTTGGGLAAGVGLVGGHISPMLAGFSSVGGSLFAQRLAPPRRGRGSDAGTGCVSAILFVVTMALTAIMAYGNLNQRALCTVIVLWLIAGSSCWLLNCKGLALLRASRIKYDRELRRWQQSSVCLQCGSVFWT